MSKKIGCIYPYKNAKGNKYKYPNKKPKEDFKMNKDMKEFLENAKMELDKAYEDGSVEELNRSAEKILNITKAMWMMGVENTNEIK